MARTSNRLFPELSPHASLRWYVYLFGDGSISRDPARAIAARRAGEFVRLWPRDLRAAYLLRRNLEPTTRTA
jgi:hypothetical protein